MSFGRKMTVCAFCTRTLGSRLRAKQRERIAKSTHGRAKPPSQDHAVGCRMRKRRIHDNRTHKPLWGEPNTNRTRDVDVDLRGAEGEKEKDKRLVPGRWHLRLIPRRL